MSDATMFMRGLLELTQKTDDKTAPFIAFVDSFSGNKANIYRPEEEAEYAFEASVLTPFSLAEDDIVLACYIGRECVVLGRMRPLAQLWDVDGSTGAAIFGSVNTPITFMSTFSVPTVSSTTDTVNYQEALTGDITLTAGTWTISAMGGSNLKHSASGEVNLVIEIDGVIDVARTVNLASAEYLWIIDEHEATGIAGNQDVTVRVLYKSSDAGTTSARNPALLVIAKRTA